MKLPQARLKLLIVGSQGHARSLAEVATATERFDIVGFADDYRTRGEQAGQSYVHLLEKPT